MRHPPVVQMSKKELKLPDSKKKFCNFSWFNVLCFLPLTLCMPVGLVFLALYPEFDGYMAPVDNKLHGKKMYESALSKLFNLKPKHMYKRHMVLSRASDQGFQPEDFVGPLPGHGWAVILLFG